MLTLENLLICQRICGGSDQSEHCVHVCFLFGLSYFTLICLEPMKLLIEHASCLSVVI